MKNSNLKFEKYFLDFLQKPFLLKQNEKLYKVPEVNSSSVSFPQTFIYIFASFWNFVTLKENSITWNAMIKCWAGPLQLTV